MLVLLGCPIPASFYLYLNHVEATEQLQHLVLIIYFYAFLAKLAIRNLYSNLGGTGSDVSVWSLKYSDLNYHLLLFRLNVDNMSSP